MGITRYFCKDILSHHKFGLPLKPTKTHNFQKAVIKFAPSEVFKELQVVIFITLFNQITLNVFFCYSSLLRVNFMGSIGPCNMTFVDSWTRLYHYEDFLFLSLQKWLELNIVDILKPLVVVLTSHVQIKLKKNPYLMAENTYLWGLLKMYS